MTGTCTEGIVVCGKELLSRPSVVVFPSCDWSTVKMASDAFRQKSGALTLPEPITALQNANFTSHFRKTSTSITINNADHERLESHCVSYGCQRVVILAQIYEQKLSRMIQVEYVD